MGVGSKALFFDSDIGEEELETAPSAMPMKSALHPEQIQIFLSSYTINSFLHSITEVYEVKAWVRADKVGDMITCWQIEPLLPGLSAYYGEDQPVDIFFHIH